MDLIKPKSFMIASALAFFLCYCVSANALNWRIAYGLHDTLVEDANSHTVGGNVGTSFLHKTQSNVLFTGRANLFVDFDKDHLDNDHISIWWKTNFLVKSTLLELTKDNILFGDIESITRTNTVSSVEREIQLFPSIGYEFNKNGFLIGAKGGAGYYFLEIDDDAPRERGFTRDGLRNTTLAYNLAAESKIQLGSKFDIHLKAYYWNDGDRWLQNKFIASLSYDTSFWIKNSSVVLNAEYNQFNLDHYPKNLTGDQVLGWDHDTLARVYFEMPL